MEDHVLHSKNNGSTSESDSEINDNSPIEQVRLTVPITDNPKLPALTFRTWVLGPIACFITAFSLQYFSFRQNSVYIPVTCLNIFILLLGNLMASTFPTNSVRVPCTAWKFSLNPGPFNIKEHALINIFASSGLDSPFGADLYTTSKIFYHKNINLWLTFLVTLTTQISGYGLAGIFINFLVKSPHMWWPSCLVDVATFRALHEPELRRKGHLTSFQFFFLVSASGFAYNIVPYYFFPSVSALSVVCWVWKHSVLAQQLGSGRYGLGIGSFAVDWSVVGSVFGNPLSVPMFTVVNTMVGFILFLYILTPISYWSDTYYAKRFPLSSYDLLDFDGQRYNISRVVKKDLTLDQTEYRHYSNIYMSTMSLYANGFVFAMVAASITDFVLFHAADAWNQFKTAYKGGKDVSTDVHNKLMKKYNSIPQWWFYVILVSTIALSILTSEGFGRQTQLPYWVILIAYLMTFLLILPFGVIQATSGQNLSVDLVSELVIGYVYPGKPLGNMVFRAYSISMLVHAIKFITDFKLAHYMKIPPKSMFLIQVAGTLLSTVGNSVAVWLVVTKVKNICDASKLPLGSQWTCPSQRSAFSSNIVWGLVGPSRVFAPYGLYSKVYYFFLVGVIASLLVWTLSRLYPDTKWIRLVSVPLIFAAPTVMPAYGAVSYWSSFVVALIFNYFVFRRYREWWAKYNYLLGSGLDFGVALMVFLTSFTLQSYGTYGVNWWGLDMGDHCPLAQCPTAPGVIVAGCPIS